MITTNLPQSPIHVFLPLHKLRVSVVYPVQYLIYNIYIDIKDSIQPKIAAKKNDISTRFQLFENPKNALKKTRRLSNRRVYTKFTPLCQQTKFKLMCSNWRVDIKDSIQSKIAAKKWYFHPIPTVWKPKICVKKKSTSLHQVYSTLPTN